MVRNRAAFVSVLLLAAGLLAVPPQAWSARWMLGFGLRGVCTGCHGLPPVAPCDETVAFAASPTLALQENYAGGGGAHWVHVQFLRGKLGISDNQYEGRLCTPCHGPSPGRSISAWHLESGFPAAWTWPAGNQLNVDLIDGANNFGSLAQYDGGGALRDVLTTESAKGGEPQRCQNFNCHGPGATVKNFDVTANDPYAVTLADPGALLWDQVCYDGATTTANQALAGRDNACAGCHASTAPDVSTSGVLGEPDTQIDVGSYSSSLGAQGATAHYFGTVSGYGRGGHGDQEIQNEDPAIDSDPNNVTPLSCTACHDDALGHFPALSGNLHRLANANLEENTHTSGLCNTCHTGATYPTNHHPSFYGPTGANSTDHDIIPAVGQEIYSAPPSGYAASGAFGDPDFFVDFWGGAPGNGNQTPAPTPSPDPVLPLERYVGNQSATDKVMCVTCHNPHGTDLFVFDPGAVGGAINDNNMLRLRDEDNTLCDGCH